jgi:imidazolonepropionase-like amidohydrolase
VSNFLLPSILADITRQLEKASPPAAGWTEKDLTTMQANVAAAAAAGIPLAAGTALSDALLGLHWEMELLVEAGLTPLDALNAATRGAATALGVGDRLGIIAEGALADLVVLNSDPLKDIRNTRQIWAVIKQGQIVDRKALLMQAQRRNVTR